jgi:hypothetical protein
MARPRHATKEIEDAVAYAMGQGWVFTRAAARAHVWGTLRCPHGERDGCTFFVQSTPRVPRNHADQLRKRVDRCPH